MKSRTHRALAIAAAAAALVGHLAITSPSSAAPPANGTILTLTWEEGSLYSLDPTTGAPTLLGTSNLLSSTGIEWDETTQTLFGIDYDNSPASLYTIDPATGAATVVGSLELDEPTAISSQPGTGVLFIAYDNPDGPGSVLATVNKTTAAVTDIALVQDAQDQAVRIAGMAFRRADGVLFGFSYADQLVQIDPVTAEATIIAPETVEGIGTDFDCQDRLLAIDSENPGSLVEVDTETGATTPIGTVAYSNDSDFVEDLTVVCDVPEPTTTTTSSTTSSTTTTAPAAQAVTVTPRFTG